MRGRREREWKGERLNERKRKKERKKESERIEWRKSE